MNTTLVRQDLLNSLKADPEYRHAWNLENVYTGICFQIRALREQRELSQSGLGKVAKMAQERISILEDPNAGTKPTLNTLLRLADAFDVGLDVRFVPYRTVIDRSTQTDMKELEVPSFKKELPELQRLLDAELKHQDQAEKQEGESGSIVAPFGVTQCSNLPAALTAPSNVPLGFDPALWYSLATPFTLSSALQGEPISLSASFPQDVVEAARMASSNSLAALGLGEGMQGDVLNSPRLWGWINALSPPDVAGQPINTQIEVTRIGVHTTSLHNCAPPPPIAEQEFWSSPSVFAEAA